MVMTFCLLLLNLFVTLAPQFGGGICGCEDKPQVNTLAVVNGVKISKQELGSDAQNKISLLQSQVITARGAELDLQVTSLLLDAEAKKRGISSEQLIQIEVLAKIPAPTEAEALAFYKERKQHIGESFKTVRPQIIALIKSERERLEVLRYVNSLRAAANIVVLIPNVTPPAGEEELNRVFVTVNGHAITSRDIESSLAPLIFNVQQQVYKVRKDDLDLRINDILLEQEAKRRNLLPEDLLLREVRSRLPIITDQEAKTFYDQNRSKFRDDFDKVKFQIIQYLLGVEQQRLVDAFAAQLRQNAAIQIYLTPPDSPSFRIAIDDQPTRGNPAAQVTVVQFTDFENPDGPKQYAEFEKLISEFGARVKFVVRDCPLTQHQNAIRAAEAAEAARDQGRYWEYAALLYANQSALQEDDLKRYASQLGLDRRKFDAAVDSRIFSSRVQRDIKEGTKLGLTSLPAYFLNGRLVTNNSYEGLKAAIQAALKALG